MVNYDPIILQELDANDRQLLLMKPGSLTEDQKYQRRKLQNRIASISSRHKKAKQLGSLEQTTQSLKDQLTESQMTIRLLRVQFNEMLTILSRSGAFEDAKLNSPDALTPPIDHRYSINAPFEPEQLTSIASLGLKESLIKNLNLFDPSSSGLLNSQLIDEDDDYDEDDSESSDANESRSPTTRTTRRQAALQNTKGHRTISAKGAPNPPAASARSRRQVVPPSPSGSDDDEEYASSSPMSSSYSSTPSSAQQSPTLSPISTPMSDVQGKPFPKQQHLVLPALLQLPQQQQQVQSAQQQYHYQIHTTTNAPVVVEQLSSSQSQASLKQSSTSTMSLTVESHAQMHSINAVLVPQKLVCSAVSTTTLA